MSIHPTAVVATGVKIGAGVRVGPYCVVGDGVELEDDVELIGQVWIDGPTRVGARTIVHPFAYLGGAPQHVRYEGEPSRLEIGSDNIIREHVTMHRGTKLDNMVTRVGDHGFFMVGSHVAHDCVIGDHVIFANNASLSGHVEVGHHVIIGGLSAVHQFCRIGDYAFIGGLTGIAGDVIPFGSVLAPRGHLGGLNIVGLRRQGYDKDQIHTIRQAYRMLFASEGTLTERLEDVDEMFGDHDLVMQIIAFMRADTNRPLCLPRNGRDT